MQKIHGALVWFIATLFVIYAFGLNTAAAVFSTAIQTSLHASSIQVSIATGASILGFACMQIPAGYLLDKFNARFVVSGGILLLAIGNVIISFSDNLFLFTLSNFIQGLGGAFAFIAAAILISQWYSTNQFPIFFGLTQMLSCILAGIIHYFFTVMLTTHTWNTIYQGLSVYGFILLVLSLIVVQTPANHPRTKKTSLITSLRTVLSNKQILLCSLAAAMSFGVVLAYASLWYAKVQTYYGVEKLQSVLISSMIFVGIGIGTPLLGWLSNRLHSRIVVIHVSLVLGVMALLLGLYLPRFDIDTLIIIKIISFFIGFFMSGSMLFYTIVSEIATDNTRGVAISVLNTAVFLFNTLMLFIPYLFITVISKEFFTYLWVLPFSTLFAILLVYFIKETYSSH